MFLKISNIQLSGTKLNKQIAREKIASESILEFQIRDRRLPIHLVGEISVSAIDRKVKTGLSLSFEEAFVGMCYVIAATNKVFLNKYAKALGKSYGIDKLTHDRAIAIGAAFLNLMAMKESMIGLTSEEISGIVASGLMDTVFALDLPGGVVETCGMGGDRGFGTDVAKRKSINVSTLSSFVMSALGVKVAKHGSYANSTVVGSTDSLEMFGADTTPSSENKIKELFEGGFCYIDAHLSKTLHDLSHLIMMETINHVVGPMTPPFSKNTPILKIMGVNDKVSPREVASAYAELHERNIQKNRAAFVVAGLDFTNSSGDPAGISDQMLRKMIILDEVSPYSTIVSIAVEGKYLGDQILFPSDFGIEIDPKKIEVAGDINCIHRANVSALKGENIVLAKYLAMNSALGLYADQFCEKHKLTGSPEIDRDALKLCFRECIRVIQSGCAFRKMEEFVIASK